LSHAKTQTFLSTGIDDLTHTKIRMFYKDSTTIPATADNTATPS